MDMEWHGMKRNGMEWNGIGWDGMNMNMDMNMDMETDMKMNRTAEWAKEWMSEWVSERMNEWVNEWVSDWASERTNESMNAQKNALMKPWMNQPTNKSKNSKKRNQWITQKNNEWVSERVSECARVSEWMGEWVHACVRAFLHPGREGRGGEEGVREWGSEGVREWGSEGVREWVWVSECVRERWEGERVRGREGERERGREGERERGREGERERGREGERERGRGERERGRGIERDREGERGKDERTKGDTKWYTNGKARSDPPDSYQRLETPRRFPCLPSPRVSGSRTRDTRWKSLSLARFCSELPASLSYTFCSFCDPVLLFAQLLQCVWPPPAAIPHGRSDARSMPVSRHNRLHTKSTNVHRFLVKSSSRYTLVHIFLTLSSKRAPNASVNVLAFLNASRVELSLHSRALFVDNFARSRPATAETQTLL